jgi:Flp pilus assembly protein TadD
LTLRTRRLLGAAVAAAACAAYATSLRGAFLFDDLPYIVDNPAVRRLWPPTALTWNSLRPLTFYSFAVSHALSGYDVWAYHVMNLAVHVAAALALFGVARRALLLPRVGLADDEAALTAFVVALLWSVHPLNTESVTYVIQRAESMAGCATLLALYGMLRSAATDDPRARRGWNAAAALAFYAGLGSKETAVVAPALVYLCDALLVTGSFVEPLRRRRGLYLGLAAPFVVVPALWLAFSPSRFDGLRPSPDSPATLDYLASQPAVIVAYLRLVVWPAGLNLDRGWNPDAHRDAAPWADACMLAALALTAEAVRRRAPAGFLPAAFFTCLAPSSSFHPLSDRMAEHRAYLAAAACVALAVIAGRRALAFLGPTRRRIAAAAVVGAVAAALAAATAARNLDYGDAVRMWTDAVAKAPENPRARYNLGCASLAAGGADAEDAALAAFGAATELRPSYPAAQNNIGVVLYRRGRFEEAAEHLRRACAGGAAPVEALRNCACALIELRRYDEAASYLRRAEARGASDGADDRTASARLWNDLGARLALSGAQAQALARFQRAVDLDPTSLDARTNLAAALARAGRVVPAIDAYLAALAVDPSSQETRTALVALCVDPANRDVAQTRLADLAGGGPDAVEARRALEFVRRAR